MVHNTNASFLSFYQHFATDPEFQLESIVAFTAEINVPSVRLMKRLGMQFSHVFAHPALCAASPLSRHVLFEMSRSAWTSARRPFADLFKP